MSFNKTLGAFAVALIAFFCLPPCSMAGFYNQATKVTFGQSVEIPGKILPAGTYWLQTVGRTSEETQNAVNIYNADRSRLITTVMTVTADRRNTSGLAPTPPVVTLAERKSNQPPALTTWFYWDSVDGHQFVYPAAEQQELARDQKVIAPATH